MSGVGQKERLINEALVQFSLHYGSKSIEKSLSQPNLRALPCPTTGLLPCYSPFCRPIRALLFCFPPVPCVRKDFHLVFPVKFIEWIERRETEGAQYTHNTHITHIQYMHNTHNNTLKNTQYTQFTHNSQHTS